MAERGLIQRGLDGVANWHRDHQGTDYGMLVFTAGAGAAAVKVSGAEAAIVAGGIVTIVSSGVDYFNHTLGKYWPQEENAPALPAGFQEEETVLMTAEELGLTAFPARNASELALAGGAEEGSASS